MDREGLQLAFDRWAAAVKAAELEPIDQLQLNHHVADELRSLPDPGANKGGAPKVLQAVADELEAFR
jgi:hypothetical protein